VNNLRCDFLEWYLYFASITIVNVFLQKYVDLICINQENRVWSIDYVVDQKVPVDLDSISLHVGIIPKSPMRRAIINFYIGCAILRTKDESHRKFFNMQCMRKAKDHRQTA
jgi:hypothetical protein